MWEVWLFLAYTDRRRFPGCPAKPTPTWRTHKKTAWTHLKNLRHCSPNVKSAPNTGNSSIRQRNSGSDSHDVGLILPICTHASSLRKTIQVMLTPTQKAESSNIETCGRFCKYGKLFSGTLRLQTVHPSITVSIKAYYNYLKLLYNIQL